MAKYQMKMTEYYMTYAFEGDTYLRCYDTKEELFNDVSRIYAFSDCETEGIEILLICCEGDACDYCGWEPGMRMRFVNAWPNEVVWDKTYPQWEH